MSAIFSILARRYADTPLSSSIARKFLKLSSKIDEINDRIQSVYKNSPKDSNGRLIDRTDYDSLMDERATIVSELQKLQDEHGIVGYEPYRRLAGEIEARDTAYRGPFTAEDRGKTPPYSSENIPPDRAILLQANLFSRAREIGRRITDEVKAWGQKVDDFVAGNLKGSKPLEVGTTPEVLQRVGAKELSLTMTPCVLAKITGEAVGQHGLDPEIASFDARGAPCRLQVRNRGQRIDCLDRSER